MQVDEVQVSDGQVAEVLAQAADNDKPGSATTRPAACPNHPRRSPQAPLQ